MAAIEESLDRMSMRQRPAQLGREKQALSQWSRPQVAPQASFNRISARPIGGM